MLAHWGVRSTSDIGNIVYNMIAAGGLEKTESDSRSDFDNLFDFETVFKAASHEAIADSAQNRPANWIPPRIETDPGRIPHVNVKELACSWGGRRLVLAVGRSSDRDGGVLGQATARTDRTANRVLRGPDQEDLTVEPPAMR